MIIDPHPPDQSRRRWPFLFAWSLAACGIVVALYLTHTPASVPLSAPQVQPAAAAASPRITVRHVLEGRSLITRSVSVIRAPQGSIIYLDQTGTWVAVGPNDNVMIPPDSSSTRLP
jgi:hypothetical protein